MSGFAFTVDATFNMGCGHSFTIAKVSKRGAEEYRKLLFDKQHDMCGKCYVEYCEKNKITPWYASNKGEGKC